MRPFLVGILFWCSCTMVLTAGDAPVVPVAITSADVERCGGWPLARRWYAAFIQQVRAGGAGRIFIDIAFVQPDPLHPESDAAFYDIIAQDDRIHLLMPSQSAAGPTVEILGTRSFPVHRTFLPYSRGVDFLGGRLAVRDTNTLTGAILDGHRPAGTVLIASPSRDIPPPLTFVEVLNTEPQLRGADVVLFLDHPGVTSYIVTPSGEHWPTTRIQLWAAEEIR